MVLPNTYQEVEYIQSSGTQYINTGYTPTTSTNFRMKLNVVSGPNQWNCFIGSRNSSNASSPAYWLGWNNGSGYQGSLVYLFYPSTQYSYTGIGSISIGTASELSFINKVLSKDGTSSSTINYTSAPSYPLFLFAGNTGGSASDYSNIKLYYCNIYNGNTLVRDFVPCYRKSDNVAGLYDLVNNVFYTNSGTGKFTKGPNVVYSKIYVGSTNIGDDKIWLGGNKDYSAMRGPCPSGFHVPLKSEWEAVNNAGIALGAWSSSNGAGLKTYLKMPYNGSRGRYNTLDNQGTDSSYSTSSANTNDSNQAYSFGFNNGGTYIASLYRSLARGIRAFRDNPIIPDNSWTVLKQGTGTAGIYRNSSLGLISISSDGTTWYTLADKNLGATTVYNDGDTLSEANCGKYYQWGNNYGFPRTGNVTTSTSQVNAQNYGPGNYYSSSTFIVRSGSPAGWDSSGNNNLRGGVTGVKSGVKAVYLGSKQVRPGYWEYSYDFRSKTTTQLTNDGWTLGSGYTCDSEGLYVSNNWNVYCSHNIESVKNANKITLESALKTSTSYGHSFFCNNESYTSTNFGIGYNQSSIRGNVEYDTTNISDSASLNNVGVVSLKFILDIKNGTWNYNIGSYSKSGTLTLPGSSYNNNYIGLKSSGSRLQTIKLTVEY